MREPIVHAVCLADCSTVRADTIDTPRISVVLSFRNPGDGLHAAISSLLWQSEQNWELIAIDDGSSDNSADLTLLHGDPRIHLIRHDTNAGLAVRLNEAIQLARGCYIARMDADDVCFPQRFRRQADFLDAHPEIDLLASAALMIDANDHPIGILPSYPSHTELTKRPWAGFPMPHPSWMGRRAWFLAHPYDPQARKAQDLRLLYQTWRTSQFSALTEPLLAYRYPALSASKSIVTRAHVLRAVWKYGTFMDVLRASAIHSFAAMRDLLAILFSMEQSVIRRRTQPAPQHVLGAWQELAKRLKTGVRS